MMGSHAILQRGSVGPVSDDDAVRLATLPTDALCEAARARRDRVWGKHPHVLPQGLSARHQPVSQPLRLLLLPPLAGDADEWTMSPDEVREWLQRAHSQGCVEALFCLGDTPETGFREYRALLRSWGHESTVEYLHWAAEEALGIGLLPHTNAGILTAKRWFGCAR